MSRVVEVAEFLKRANRTHHNKYDYSKVCYNVLSDKVEIICPVHGSFLQHANKHLSGNGCPRCANNVRLTKEEFITKANKIHNNKYSYNKTMYKGHAYKIIITCPIHGDFSQLANKHINGDGCPECAKETKGWNYSLWEKAGLTSSRFDGFKLYIIECWNDNERFYKAGKTFNKLSRRFKTKIKMPYEWKVIKLEEGSARYISELEIKLKRKNSNSSYIPKISFKGMNECYSSVNQ